MHRHTRLVDGRRGCGLGPGLREPTGRGGRSPGPGRVPLRGARVRRAPYLAWCAALAPTEAATKVQGGAFRPTGRPSPRRPASADAPPPVRWARAGPPPPPVAELPAAHPSPAPSQASQPGLPPPRNLPDPRAPSPAAAERKPPHRRAGSGGLASGCPAEPEARTRMPFPNRGCRRALPPGSGGRRSRDPGACARQRSGTSPPESQAWGCFHRVVTSRTSPGLGAVDTVRKNPRPRRLGSLVRTPASPV